MSPGDPLQRPTYHYRFRTCIPRAHKTPRSYQWSRRHHHYPRRRPTYYRHSHTCVPRARGGTRFTADIRPTPSSNHPTNSTPVITPAPISPSQPSLRPESSRSPAIRPVAAPLTTPSAPLPGPHQQPASPNKPNSMAPSKPPASSTSPALPPFTTPLVKCKVCQDDKEFDPNKRYGSALSPFWRRS
jgi:hypothetical protein